MYIKLYSNKIFKKDWKTTKYWKPKLIKMIRNENSVTIHPQGIWGLESEGMFQHISLLNGYTVLHMSFNPSLPQFLRP